MTAKDAWLPWIKAWFGRLQTIIPRHDWPDFVESKAFWDNWSKQFTLSGIKEDVATQAIEWVSANKPGLFIPDYLHAVLEQAGQICRERDDKIRGEAEEAKERCRDCPECGGEGWASREFLAPSTHGAVKMRGSLTCRCPVGREVRIRIGQQDARLLRKIDDLQAHPRLWSEKSDLFSDRPNPSVRGTDDSHWLVEN